MFRTMSSGTSYDEDDDDTSYGDDLEVKVPDYLLESAVPDCTVSVESKSNEKRLSHIPQLLLVSLQQGTAVDVERAAKELGEQTRGNEKECQALYRMGGHGLVLATLMRWPLNETIQAHCILTLSSVACFVPDCQDALLALGFVDVFAAAMTRFPDSFDVQVFALAAVHYMFQLDKCDSESTMSLKEGRNAERLHFVNDFNGIDLIVKAMSEFSRNPVMQFAGCRALCRLSPVKDFEKALCKSGAVVVVATAMRDFSGSESVQEASLTFMKDLFRS